MCSSRYSHGGYRKAGEMLRVVSLVSEQILAANAAAALFGLLLSAGFPVPSSMDQGYEN